MCFNGNIVTLGIKPTYPEVGYGYIEVKETKINTPVEVLAFKENLVMKLLKNITKVEIIYGIVECLFLTIM